MTSPAELDTQLTLRTAVARYEELRSRDLLAGSADDSADEAAEEARDEAAAAVARAEQLSREEVLEMLALGEVIAAKAGYGRQLAVRAARERGASWSAIGRSLGTTKQAAWEAHTRWIEDQAAQHRASGYAGLDDLSVARAKRLAGRPDA
jgi:hypothetical protein